MGKRLPILLVMAVVTALVAWGCGGDDEGGGSGAETRNGATEADSGSQGDGSAPETVDDQAEDAAGGEGKTIPKRAFVKQGNEICEATIGRVTAQVLPILEKQEKEKETNRRELEGELVSDVAVPELRTELEQLEALGTPPGDRARVERIFATFLDLIEEVEDDPTILVGTNKAFEGSAKLAERYGLNKCPYG